MCALYDKFCNGMGSDHKSESVRAGERALVWAVCVFCAARVFGDFAAAVLGVGDVKGCAPFCAVSVVLAVVCAGSDDATGLGAWVTSIALDDMGPIAIAVFAGD